MARKLLHRCICVHARAHMHCLRRVYMHCWQILWVPCMYTVCMFQRCCEHQRTHLLHARYGMYICAHACAVCFILRWGNEDGEVQLVYEDTCCLAWGVIFDRRKDMSVVCVFSVFNAGGSVRRCMGVYTHTHTHCTDGVLWCEPSGRDETPGGPEESRWTKSPHVCIRICVQSSGKNSKNRELKSTWIWAT